MNKIPFQFVLEILARKKPRVQPMFGCHGVYIGEKIMLILRMREDFEKDNGVWVATALEHHNKLKTEFPSLRSIGLFGSKVTTWQNLAVDADDFEESVIQICDLILKGDSRIGKVPKKRVKKSPSRKLRPRDKN